MEWKTKIYKDGREKYWFYPNEGEAIEIWKSTGENYYEAFNRDDDYPGPKFLKRLDSLADLKQLMESQYRQNENT
jgi:hypothetical protein